MMSKWLLVTVGLLGFVAVFLASGARPAAQASPSCTLVLGYSMVGNSTGWYTSDNYGFERIVPDGNWQLVWAPNMTIDRWADESRGGYGWQEWDEGNVLSACAENSLTPDRVLLSVATKDLTMTVAQMANWTILAIEEIHQRIPSVQVIVLEPIVGGPNHVACSGDGSNASSAHLRADQAIDIALAATHSVTVVEGMDPMVQSCSEFDDSAGHFTTAGGKNEGIRHGNFYSVFDGGGVTPTQTGTAPAATATSTPTPTATATPARSIVDCRLRVYYSDGTNETRTLPLSACE